MANKPNVVDDSLMDYLLSRTINGYKFNEDFKMLDVEFNTGLINDVENEDSKKD